jgi:SnoaL-like domain
MDRSGVQDWLDRYSRAWETYDAEAIGELFAENAVYRYHPWDEGDDVVRGRAAIVDSWLVPDGSGSSRDQAGTYEGRYEAFAADGDHAVGTGTSTYWTDPSRATIRTVYDNTYLLEFDRDGRCTSFTEFFMERPKPR